MTNVGIVYKSNDLCLTVRTNLLYLKPALHALSMKKVIARQFNALLLRAEVLSADRTPILTLIYVSKEDNELDGTFCKDSIFWEDRPLETLPMDYPNSMSSLVDVEVPHMSYYRCRYCHPSLPSWQS